MALRGLELSRVISTEMNLTGIEKLMFKLAGIEARVSYIRHGVSKNVIFSPVAPYSRASRAKKHHYSYRNHEETEKFIMLEYSEMTL